MDPVPPFSCPWTQPHLAWHGAILVLLQSSSMWANTALPLPCCKCSVLYSSTMCCSPASPDWWHQACLASSGIGTDVMRYAASGGVMRTEATSKICRPSVPARACSKHVLHSEFESTCQGVVNLRATISSCPLPCAVPALESPGSIHLHIAGTSPCILPVGVPRTPYLVFHFCDLLSDGVPSSPRDEVPSLVYGLITSGVSSVAYMYIECLFLDRSVGHG